MINVVLRLGTEVLIKACRLALGTCVLVATMAFAQEADDHFGNDFIE